MNLWAYCDGDPASLRDPSGHEGWWSGYYKGAKAALTDAVSSVGSALSAAADALADPVSTGQALKSYVQERGVGGVAQDVVQAAIVEPITKAGTGLADEITGMAQGARFTATGEPEKAEAAGELAARGAADFTTGVVEIVGTVAGVGAAAKTVVKAAKAFGSGARAASTAAGVAEVVETAGTAAAKGSVNLDTGTAAAFVSEGSPIRHTLKAEVAGKTMLMTETAATEFEGMLQAAGPLEAARAERLMQRVALIPDDPSVRAIGLTLTKKVGAADKIIFGTADKLGVPTMTADAKFLRGASAQGVEFDAVLHRPVPLTGQ